MKRIVASILFLLSFVAVSAQENPAISSFSLSQVPAGIRLTFTLAQGNTCLGIRILRSDGIGSFSEIGFIGGVCGSPSEEITYSFTDSMPLVNRLNYYKLDLELLGTSSIQSFRYLRYGSDGAVAIPNISSGLFYIYFQNELMQPFTLSVYDMSGRLIRDAGFANGNSVSLDLSNEGKGLFIFVIKINDNDNHNGKLVVY